MDSSLPILALYVALKAAAYCFWCVRGVRLFRPERAAPVGLGVALGGLRLVLGLGFGLGIFLAGAAVFAGLATVTWLERGVAMVLTYLAVYVPVRWLEWAIIETILVRGRGLGAFLLSSSGRGVRWRLVGIAISCLADVPLMLAAGGVPVGRFMC
jgi:hypothetical protein